MSVIGERAAGPAPSGGGSPRSRHHRILIVGAGFAGLGTAIRLIQRGIEDFLVIEKAEEVGGTWQANTYPGCQCDVPSHLYSFSFAPNPDWSRTFSCQPEIWEYLRGCAERYGIRSRIRFGVEMSCARWDDDEQLWRVETSDGPLSAEMLVSGMGGLSEPSLPEIKGLQSFAGPVFHSARWDHSVEMEGKRLAVIGTGASAIQFVPKVAPIVSELHLFQRTAPWIMPHPDRPISAFERRIYRALPAVQRAMREGIYWARELFVLPFLHPALTRPGERIARRHLASQVAEAQLRAKLTPPYRMGCKRVLLSNEYYPAIQRENVSLVDDEIVEVAPNGILTADGALHEVDAIVLGTGFHVTDMPFADYISGRDGRTLAERWQGTPKAHLGTTVAGFPNLFLLLGPYTGLGHTSVVFMIECQIDYLMDCIATMDAQRLRAIEPKAAAQEEFVEEMERRARGTVWKAGGCRSWYLDANGCASSIWPGPTWAFRSRLRRFDPERHLLRARSLPAAGGDRGPSAGAVRRPRAGEQERDNTPAASDGRAPAPAGTR